MNLIQNNSNAVPCLSDGPMGLPSGSEPLGLEALRALKCHENVTVVGGMQLSNKVSMMESGYDRVVKLDYNDPDSIGEAVKGAMPSFFVVRVY